MGLQKVIQKNKKQSSIRARSFGGLFERNEEWFSKALIRASFFQVVLPTWLDRLEAQSLPELNLGKRTLMFLDKSQGCNPQ